MVSSDNKRKLRSHSFTEVFHATCPPAVGSATLQPRIRDGDIQLCDFLSRWAEAMVQYL